MKYNYQKFIVTLEKELVMLLEDFTTLFNRIFSTTRCENRIHEPTIKTNKKLIELSNENDNALITENK